MLGHTLYALYKNNILNMGRNAIRAANTIYLGKLIQQTEPSLQLINCQQPHICSLNNTCKLITILEEAK